MSDVKWTPSQIDAITARGSNVLVNAAAGSGKTAVLTERIVQRLAPQNGEEPINADRLLVVTFTRAAASEMRQRIEKGLKKELHNAMDGARHRLISRQLRRLAAAKITTIDAFCQSVIKEYFHVLGIDPSFSVIEGSEAVIVMDEVFDALCTELYAAHNKNFYLLLSRYCRNGSENGLRNMIYALYRATRTLPYPERFIESAAEEYACRGGLEATSWYGGLERSFIRACKKTAAACRNAANTIPQGAEWDSVRSVIASDAEAVEKAMCAGLGQGTQLICEYKYPTLRMPKGADKAVCDKIKKAREAVKRSFKKLTEIKPEEPDVTADFLSNNIYPAARALSELTLLFSDRLEESKRERGVFEFSDIEQLCYRLFAGHEEIRSEYRTRFDEILIDEYQDTNALQDELFAMISRGDNLFMVGDMKQSIYRFRSSDPLVFREKADSYCADREAQNRKINLSENFRSRAEVIDAVNDLFSAAMSADAGELEYDSQQCLRCGNTGYSSTGFDYCAECIVIENGSDDEDSPERTRSEAEYIASEICRMKREGFLVRDKIKVKDKDGNVTEEEGLRPVRNSDIVILMSSHKSAAKTYAEVFAEYGVQFSCDNEGYFSRPEIKLMMSLLRIIENPDNDIAMLAVLRSAAGGFSDEEIARIRISEKKTSFCDAMFSVYSKYLAKKEELCGEARDFGERTAYFCERLLAWRDMARYMSAERLVRTVCEQAGLYAFFGAAEGEEATANLRLFFDRAQSYESAGFRGIFAFLRHMERLESNSSDLTGAATGTDGDSVRMMTIHKSKGLEMPVVFVAGCGKSFNRQSMNESLLIHKELGIALNYTSYDEGIEIIPPVRRVISDTISGEMTSEEMRKLYVALTRAKEKLIVVSCIESDALTAREKHWQAVGLEGLRVDAPLAKGFADWIAPAAMESEHWKYERIHCADTQQIHEQKREQTDFSPPDCADILSYSYPYAAERMKSKSAVSDFKGISHGSELAQKPAFLAEKGGVTGTEFGTAVHIIMETLPRQYGDNPDYVRKHIGALVQEGHIRAELLKSLSPERIVKFYSSPIGRRIAAAEKIFRESEFEIGVDAARLYNDPSLGGETALLQGIIDCWFYEDGEIVLVDYKTDRVQDIEEIHQKYDIQLALYAEALEKITKKRVKEKFIYLFSRDIVIQC